MNDLTAILIFLACLLATFGLVRACSWLNPPQSPRAGQGADPKESRP